MRSFLFLLLSPMCLMACQHGGEPPLSIRVEAESSFKNTLKSTFALERQDFYSAGAVIMLSGDTKIGASGQAEYEISQTVPPGVYTLEVGYYDENDGHAPVEIRLDNQLYTFAMNADTPSAFADAANKRTQTYYDVQVTDKSKLSVKGTVHRYKSEHRELVRVDYYEFTPQKP